MVACRNGLCRYVDPVVVAYVNLSWYLKLGCNNVGMHSRPLCSHAQAGAVTVTLRQAQQDELSEHYQGLSTLSELVCSVLCLCCAVRRRKLYYGCRSGSLLNDRGRH